MVVHSISGVADDRHGAHNALGALSQWLPVAFLIDSAFIVNRPFVMIRHNGSSFDSNPPPPTFLVYQCTGYGKLLIELLFPFANYELINE